MNLTTFVELKQVKDKFREAFPKPRFSTKQEIKAEPQTRNYGMVGTAFDYLLRFYIEAHNRESNIISRPWVAEHSIPMLKRSNSEDLLPQIQQILTNTKSLVVDYLDSNMMTDDLIIASIKLAKLDLIYRIGYISDRMTPDPGDIQDLRNLVNTIPSDMFKVRKSGVLNPTFGIGSSLVGGADCDLYLDGNLIDIKTSKYCKFDRGYFNQLIGYYFLSQFGGISGAESHEIHSISIYFSRYGVLGSYPIEIIKEASSYQETYEWFIEKAKSLNI